MDFDKENNIDVPGAARVLQRCDSLARFSETQGVIYRTYLSFQHKECNAQVYSWMEDAGMSTWTDAVGNCWGHYPGATSDAPVVILGSHLDTVANAGKYDGILGVLSAIEIVDLLNRHNMRLPFAIDVVGFGDEEGARFGTTLIGSRAVCGKWDPNWLELEDQQGISLSRALANFGLSPDNVGEADRSNENILAYIELHIEQGPVLEQHEQAVGIVTAIAGARRLKMSLKGSAGHAGTVPMTKRRDALAAACVCIQNVEQIAHDNQILATVGQINCVPGSVNVIPGLCEFTIDARSDQDDRRDQAIELITEELNNICHARDIQLEVTELHSAPAVKCTSWIQRIAEQVILDREQQPISLMSGAGHDAMAFENTADIGMLFVRCADGISHHPAESVTLEDVMEALDILRDVLLKMGDIS